MRGTKARSRCEAVAPGIARATRGDMNTPNRPGEPSQPSQPSQPQEPNVQPIHEPVNPDPLTHPIHPAIPTQPIHEGTDPPKPITMQAAR